MPEAENTNTIQQEENAATTETATESEDATQTQSEGSTEQTTEGASTEGSQTSASGEKTKAPWFQKRIDQLTAEKWEERRKADNLQKTNETLLAQLAESRKTGAAPTTAEQTNTQTPPTTPAQPALTKQDNEKLSEAEIDARASRKADQIAKEREFTAACNNTYAAGKDEFDDFDRTLNTFSMFGGIPNTVLDVVTDMPKGHAILYTLGKNPDLIEKLVNMSPTKQALELARLEASVSKPASKQVSSAPAPVKPIDGSGGRAEVDPEKMSMQDYVAWREKTARKR